MQIRRYPRNSNSSVIRSATADDVGRLLEIARGAATSAFWSEQKYLQRIGGDAGLVFVWQEGEEVTGFLVAQLIAGECEIENIAVASEHRRKGRGRALVEAAISAAQAHPCQSVWLEVRESNTAARRLYEGLGFCLATRRRRYYRDPEEDALVLKLTVSAAPDPQIGG